MPSPLVDYIVFNTIELLKVIAWPLVIFLALWFFRKVFTYLFFSMDEFNFFGAKGRLDNPIDMIKREAKKLKEKDDEEQKIMQKYSEYEKTITNLQNSKSEESQKALDNLSFARELIRENQRILRDKARIVAERQAQVDALLSQLAALQVQQLPGGSPSSSILSSQLTAQVEEYRDVGATNNPGPETSKAKK